MALVALCRSSVTIRSANMMSGLRGALQHTPLVSPDPAPNDRCSLQLLHRRFRGATPPREPLPALHMTGRHANFSTSSRNTFQLRAAMEFASDSLPTAVNSSSTAQLPVITPGMRVQDAIPAAYARLGRQPDAHAAELVRVRAHERTTTILLALKLETPDVTGPGNTVFCRLHGLKKIGTRPLAMSWRCPRCASPKTLASGQLAVRCTAFRHIESFQAHTQTQTRARVWTHRLKLWL